MSDKSNIQKLTDQKAQSRLGGGQEHVSVERHAMWRSCCRMAGMRELQSATFPSSTVHGADAYVAVHTRADVGTAIGAEVECASVCCQICQQGGRTRGR